MADDLFTEDQDGDKQRKKLLEELVGEDKKYKTVEDLAKSRVEADNFIEQLKREKQEALDALQEAEEKAKEGATVSELLEKFKAQANGQDTEEGDTPQSLTEDNLRELVKETMKGETEAQTRARNRSEANQLVLSQVDGDVEAAKAYVAERAKQLGMSPSKLADLSEESPSAFASLMGLQPSTGSQRGVMDLPGNKTEGRDSGTARLEIDGHKTKAYYDGLRKEMGTYKYLNDRKIQLNYMRDAEALGWERFQKGS